MDLLQNLNLMQREGVLTTEGPLLLLAGAGSGKTSVLTRRAAYLIEKGVNPFNIIAITFTNKAAREMKERLEALVGSDNVWVSTFHSSCVRILRREINRIGYSQSFTIYDADDSDKLIKLVIRELNINEKQFPPKAALSEIGKAKDELLTPSAYEKEVASDYWRSVMAKIYHAYQRKLKESNALDFDDIIFKTVELFQACPDVLEKYQNRFKYIMVDEYQDTNTSQYTFVRLLSGKYQNLCVVGDDDQSIYGWRGANIRNILDFEKDYPNAKVIKLEQNYRSTKNILNTANAVISNNIGRKSKKLWTEHIEGGPVKIFKAATDLDESAYITDTILRGKMEGEAYSNFAVLYRTNAQSRILEDSFVKKNIPYRIFGGTRFYERREIKDVLAYLKALYNPLDEIALKRIINVPRRGIGNTTVDKISLYANENGWSFFDALKEVDFILGVSARNSKIKKFTEMIDELRASSMELPVSQLIQEVLDKTEYLLELLSEKTDEAKDRVENVNELIAKALEYEKQSEEPGLLAGFLEEVALVADIDGFTEGDDTVVLMTLHSSKGLEFPTVFIAGFEEGIFPSFRSMTSGDMKELEEERRLCYVGITRAKETLYLTMANQRMQHGHVVYNAPSSFLKEIPKEYIEDMNQKVKNARIKELKEAAGPEEKSGKEASPKTSMIRSGIAQNHKPEGFGAKNYNASVIPTPKDASLDFQVGDKVRQMKYGVGEVVDISPAGADFEVTVSFSSVGKKKFMAHLSKLVKA